MPITYSIDADTGTIRTRCAGDVKLADVIAHLRDLARDPHCPAHLDVFLDLTEVGTLPDSGQLKDVVGELKRISSRVHFGACAILAERDALFGMMRMFEVVADQSFQTARTFRARADAEAWLASHRASRPSSACR